MISDCLECLFRTVSMTNSDFGRKNAKKLPLHLTSPLSDLPFEFCNGVWAQTLE